MRRMTIIGIVAVVVGIVLGIGLTGLGITLKASSNPETSNVGTITGPGDVLAPGPGTYQIWTKESVSGDITASRPGGEMVTVERESDEVTLGDFTLYGEVKLSEEGNYSFLYSGSVVLYVTEVIPLGTFAIMTYAGIIGGVVLVVTGVILIVIGIKRQRAIDHSGFFHDAPPK